MKKIYADEAAKMNAARHEAERLLQTRGTKGEVLAKEIRSETGYSSDDEERALIAKAIRQKMQEDRLVV